MKITFDKTDEQLDLIKQMGSSDKTKSYEAQAAFVRLMAPIIGQYFNQADTTSFLYKSFEYNQDDDPSLPIDLYSGITEGHYTVWTQQLAGGLPTNYVYEPMSEIKFTPYRLDSAISYSKKYARKARLDVVGKAMERLVQEVLIKTQHNAWAILLATLGGASNNSNSNVYRSSTANILNLNDFNKTLTYFRRLNRSFAGGTPVGGNTKPTDMICSPEITEQLRGMAYNPINTKAANGLNAEADSAGVGLPEAARARVFATAGAPEFFGISIVELLELGLTQNYQTIFSTYSTASLASIDSNSQNAGAFNAATDELIIFVDAAQDFAYRALEVGEDSNSTFTLEQDDQFLVRSDKIGMYGYVTEGRVVTQSKPLMGLVV